MRINHNIAALNTYRQLSANSTNSSKSLEKLSSGLRINKAGDDAAGLAISEKMRGQIRGLDQASRNAQDGISMIQTSEGALAETQSILQRMKELATQSANGSNTDSDRAEIQKEMNQLSSEINRIGNTTEFNTQKLLKGKTTPVVETAAAVNTATAGQAGVAAGATSALSVDANSVKAVSSTATVQASTSVATGSIDSFSITKNSTKGVKSTVSLANGLNFTAATSGTGSDGKTITIEQADAGTTTTSISNSGSTWTIKIGTNADGSSVVSNRGELYNAIVNSGNYGTFKSNFTLDTMTNTSEVVSDVSATGTTAGGVNEVRGEYSFTLADAFEEAGDTISFGGATFTAVIGAADSSKGEFSIGATAASLYDSTEQATDSVANTDGTLLEAITAVLGDRFANNISATNVINLKEVANAATGVDVTSPTVAGSGSNDKLTITDASGRNLKTVTIVQGASGAVAGAKAATTKLDTNLQITAGNEGTDLNGVKIKFNVTETTAGSTTSLTSSWDADNRTLTISGDLGDSTDKADVADDILAQAQSVLTAQGFKSAGTLTVAAGASDAGSGLAAALNAGTMTFGTGAGGATTGATKIAAGDTLAVDTNDGNLKIYLASATASNNTAAKIESAIQALGTVNGVDYSQYTAKAEGAWDTKTVGNSIIKSLSTLVGGTQEVKGTYSFDVTKAFAVGDRVEVKGQVFTAVASGAKASNGEFEVGTGDTAAQALSLRDAISLNAALKNTYSVSGAGSNITLTEKVGTGTDLQSTDLAVRATGTQGEYSVAAPELLTSGAKFIVDGQEITVSDKNEHVGYANGTAVKEAASVADQTKALVSAINTNANLKDKYTASVGSDGSLVLKQTAAYTTATAPVVSTKSSAEGDFTSTFQVGANSGQSMTIQVADMRSKALGITGDGTASTVKASNGSVASYVSTANVTDGTTNTNVEFALDVSTYDKATSAIGVLDDAIAAVSAQRSQLGAYQNRLEHTINNLGTSSENLTAAESRVRDVDMAKEMMEFTKNNILSQAAQAMMAQANQQPQGVLQLLR